MQKGLESLAGTGSRISGARVQEKPRAGAGAGLDFAEAQKVARERVGPPPIEYILGHLGEATKGKDGLTKITHTITPQMIDNLERKLVEPHRGIRAHDIGRYEVLKNRSKDSDYDMKTYLEYVKDACRSLDIRK